MIAPDIAIVPIKASDEETFEMPKPAIILKRITITRIAMNFASKDFVPLPILVISR